MFLSQKKFLNFLAIVAAASLLLAVGCRKAAPPPPPTPVKTMAALQKDTRLSNEYAGQVQGKNEVRIQARVTGNVMEKMISGGQLVKKGQPLFKIDSRPYVSAMLSAQAQLAQSEAVLANTRLDAQRYRELYQAAAISAQQLAAQETAERQQEALTNANRALWQKAQDDLNDTLVTSPIDGRLYVDDVSVGTFVQAGATTLVTVGVLDPVFVVFSMSENEYLSLRQTYHNQLVGSDWGEQVTIALSNGSQYPLAGQVAQIDRALGASNGTLTIKASFANPDGVLIPGMFARAKIPGLTLKDAVLIPQRSVQQVLDKSFVMVLAPDNKVKARQVTLGRKTGSFQIVESGLAAGEIIVVEGLARVQDGRAVAPTPTTPEELKLTLE